MENNYYQNQNPNPYGQQPYRQPSAFVLSDLFTLAWKNIVRWVSCLLFILVFVPTMKYKMEFWGAEVKMHVSNFNMLINHALMSAEGKSEWTDMDGKYVFFGIILFLVPLALFIISSITTIKTMVKAIVTISCAGVGFLFQFIALGVFKDDAAGYGHITFFFVFVILFYLVALAAGILMLVTKSEGDIASSFNRFRVANPYAQPYAQGYQQPGAPVQPAAPVQPQAPVQPAAPVQPQAPVQPAAGAKFCPNCGQPVTGKFCAKCGTMVQ